MQERQHIERLHTLDRTPPGGDLLEWPEGYDYDAAKQRAAALADRLSEDFGRRWIVAPHQDTRYHFGVFVENYAPPLAIRLSNYGYLAAVTTPSPHSHRDLDHAISEGALTSEQRALIETALADLDYTFVPAPLLHRRYDGVTYLADLPSDQVLHECPPHKGATWWERFFDYT